MNFGIVVLACNPLKLSVPAASVVNRPVSSKIGVGHEAIGIEGREEIRHLLAE
jgi:hypothetical protein